MRSFCTEGEWQAAWSLLLGWFLNLSLTLGLLQIFLMYACEFATLPGVEDTHLIQRELMFGWAWSILQRLVLNEPLIIVGSRGLPLMLHSSICACLCTEAIVEYISQAVEASASVVKEFFSV
jgi:hypothetical protein